MNGGELQKLCVRDLLYAVVSAAVEGLQQLLGDDGVVIRVTGVILEVGPTIADPFDVIRVSRGLSRSLSKTFGVFRRCGSASFP